MQGRVSSQKSVLRQGEAGPLVANFARQNALK